MEDVTFPFYIMYRCIYIMYRFIYIMYRCIFNFQAVLPKKGDFLLAGAVLEATMINPKYKNQAIQFELSIGNTIFSYLQKASKQPHAAYLINYFML